MKRIALALTLTLLAACGVLRFPGGSSEYDLAWVFEIDTNKQTASAELSTASTGVPIARCSTSPQESIIETIKAFDFTPAYTIPSTTGGPTIVALRSGDKDIGECRVFNLKAWETIVALRSKA